MAFLTVVTRHMPERAELLERNRGSLTSQTDPDYQQLVLTDAAHSGFAHMYAMLSLAKQMISGEYVLILDDDDMMTATDGIAALKEAAREGPPAVIFRGSHADLGILPAASWQARPVKGDIGSFDFILRADVYREFCGTVTASAYACDHAIIAAVYDAHGAARVQWLDKVICAADKRRIGEYA